MGEAAQLITAIAALVTAIGSVTTGIIFAALSLARQREAAAKEATRLTRRHRGGDIDDPEPVRHRHRATRRGPDPDVADHARRVARDAQDLAVETRREQRLDNLERRDDRLGGGGDA